MLKEKIQELRSEITKKQTAINTKIKEAQKRAEEDNLEEAKTIKDEITSLKAEIETMTAKLKDLEELAGMKQEEVTEGEERAFKPRSPKVNFTNEIEEMRSKVNDYIRSYGQTRDGLKTIDAEPVIPVEILTTPQREPEDVVDLASMVNKKPVKTGSGTYPVVSNAKNGLVSVAELAKNPELATPEFKKVAYDVETYRGQLPISQESIDDSGIDLTALIAEHLQQTKRITTNRAVANVLKTFSKKTVSNVDGIKQIVNVDLKQAYKRDYVATASAYQWLDTLKDKNGQYLLQPDITSPSGKSFIGKPVSVVDDEVLGTKAGDMVMFVGDLKAGVFFADRVDVTAKWVDNDVYGQVLSIATRFDTKQADEKAGFFVTIKPPVETGATE
ncbi:phage major capsid protein [Bacillus safensis]|uniref:phage major capsid protein n=1 Tax=Bacillus safensis TaxID=561879 RepID=UPI0020C93CBF|nr:phage major capsid protein [Bacillus safensis]MCP8952569.1 phage major capsid protein [Bacillus safensis]